MRSDWPNKASLTRRTLLKRLAATGVSASFAATLGLPADRGRAGRTDAGRRQAAPRRPYQGREPRQFYRRHTGPAKGALSTDYARHYSIYSGLTQFDGELNPLPALAESFDTDDQQVWVFNLRKGVEFHNGKPFTAEDVVYSLPAPQRSCDGLQSRLGGCQYPRGAGA